MNIVDAFVYCIKCGAPTINEGLVRECPKCKLIRYIGPYPATGALITERNKLLLVKRGGEPAKDTWDLPGGFIKPVESAEESIRREIKEELGVNVVKIEYFNSKYDRYEYSGVEDFIFVVNFKVEIEKTEIECQDDISDYKYFDLSKIPYNEIYFPSIIETIKELIRLQ